MRLRAVTFGFAVVAILAFFLVALPGIGHVAVGLAGGFVGGVLAGGGPRPGLRHGAAVGGLGALLALAVGAVLIGTAGVASGVPPILEPAVPLSIGEVRLTLLGATALAVTASLAGAVGGWLRGETEFPDRLEEERAVR